MNCTRKRVKALFKAVLNCNPGQNIDCVFNNNKLYYQIEKGKKVKTLQYNILIQKEVMFTQDNYKANRAE